MTIDFKAPGQQLGSTSSAITRVCEKALSPIGSYSVFAHDETLEFQTCFQNHDYCGPGAAARRADIRSVLVGILPPFSGI